jgi:hypothetical protein
VTNSVFNRLLCAFFAAAALQTSAADPAKAQTPGPVLLPGEYAVSRFDFARGSGTTLHSCAGHVTIGPGIGPSDLEVTYVKENSIRIALKGTSDAMLCMGFYAPARRRLAEGTVFRFYDANRWSFEDIDRRANLRAQATQAVAQMRSGRPAASAWLAGAPPLPNMMDGRWSLAVTVNGRSEQREECGDPLAMVKQQVSELAAVEELGCSARTASSGARNFSLVVDCPADRVDANGSRFVRKGQATLIVTSPTPQSFSMTAAAPAMNYRETVDAVRVGDCP